MAQLWFFNSLVILSVLLGCVFAQTTPTCARTYTVQSGDWCDKISADQNVSTFQLANANPSVDANCDNLFVGQVLCLGFAGHDCTVVHVVASGEGCDTIGSNAGITFATLHANNPNIDADCTNIYPGEVLCIASEVVTVPPPGPSATPDPTSTDLLPTSTTADS